MARVEIMFKTEGGGSVTIEAPEKKAEKIMKKYFPEVKIKSIKNVSDALRYPD